ncbi:hypothetical protein FAZ15_05685 [Sphingobacterium olei]|uniref:Uncharacterized protein n=1 Tax=Sphingobacterium olei TaxID=2571155 RepID=A0A4U0P3X6_9SPHI|nr:DUF4998 domain-containing protein [Sphingobacterium olei]TJZ62003.1 hypothetical protein FAZ15_05685 [Sphingobacterium olei]
MRKNSISLIAGIFCAGVLFLISCTKQDHFYKDFVVDRNYIGKPDSIWVQPGEYRALVGWVTPTDSEAKDIIIRWSQTDSVVKAIDHNVAEQSVIIDNLEERDYIFNAYTTDRKGNRSLLMELSIPVYGDVYRATLKERELSHSVFFPSDSIALVWNGKGLLETLYGSEIEYTDHAGVKQKVVSESTSTIGALHGVDPDEPITIRTTYRPHPNALDYFYLEPEVVDLNAIKRTSLTFSSVSYTDAIYVDFKYARGFLIGDVPRRVGKDIDMAYALGAGSRGNLFTIDGDGFAVFASAWQSQIAQWPIRNVGKFKRLPSNAESVALYESLDEMDREQMAAAYNNSTVAESNRLFGTIAANTILKPNDVALLWSADRDLYIAIKVTGTPPPVSGALGDFSIEFKVSKP